jgi:hypothetical protein
MVDVGIIGSLGFEIGLTKSLVLTADARGEATTELLTASVRGGLSYRIPRRESQ